jgi:hypothetical protein
MRVNIKGSPLSDILLIGILDILEAFQLEVDLRRNRFFMAL